MPSFRLRSTARRTSVRLPFTPAKASRSPLAYAPVRPSLVYVELLDSVSLSTSGSTVTSASSASLLTRDAFAVQLRPLQVLLLARLNTGSAADLDHLHDLLFAVLLRGVDSSLSQDESALLGNAAVTGYRCLQDCLTAAAARVSAPSGERRSDKQTHMQLAALLLSTPACTASRDSVAALRDMLNVLSGDLPDYVLGALLTVPCAPELLAHLVRWAVTRSDGCVDAALFSLAMHALLSNDNFFGSRGHFDAMHRLVRDVVIDGISQTKKDAVSDRSRNAEPHDSAGPSHFDYLAIRWTPLMNKWARVYGRQARAVELYECYAGLLTAVPAAENRMPCSFYVRLIGSFIDAEGDAVVDGAVGARTTDEQVAAVSSWEKVRAVAATGVRMLGCNEQDAHQLWVVLLKAALTLSPLSEDWRRLLESHHLFAAQGHPRPLHADRGAFLQVLRLVLAAINRQTMEQAATTVRQLTQFFAEQESISFLWLLDASGTVLRELWQRFGLAGRDIASNFVSAVMTAIDLRGVAGVRLDAHPVVARGIADFALDCAQPNAFWWRCGCGEELPSYAKRCTACLRRDGSSWTCSRCQATHRSVCGAQDCSCGGASPRRAAALAVVHTLCAQCGEVMRLADAHCVHCDALQRQSTATCECAQCGAQHSAKALYCPTCFTPRHGSSLHLWHCGSCQELNYSAWSTCHSCRSPRRTDAIRVPFVPWRCHCGGVSHPCRLHCEACTAKAGPQGRSFTCDGCASMTKVSRLEEMQLPLASSPVTAHLCGVCGTVHPRDRAVLCSPSLPRHCLLCGDVVRSESVRPDGLLYHCATHQQVNEYVAFECAHCTQGHAARQAGYHCAHCMWPRPEIEALPNDSNTHYVWRCLRERGDDAQLCGAWNYSWVSSCRQCQAARGHSKWECRARAYAWDCAECKHHNRPIDTVTCAHCGSATQPVPECAICGICHLTQRCDDTL